jgi:hypothetical protein
VDFFSDTLPLAMVLDLYYRELHGK